MSKNVLLIGWFNSRPSQLKNYFNIYRKLGFKNINHLQYKPSDVLFLTRGREFCDNYNLNNPVKKHYNIIHTFSGGSIIAFYLSKLGVTYDKIIFDSGPMYLTSECFANFLCNHPQLPKFLSSKFIFNFIKFIVNKIWNLERKRSQSVNKLHLSLINDYEGKQFLLSYHPKLILNDPCDKLLLQNKFYDLYKQKNVTYHHLYNSKHIQHLKFYPKFYYLSIKNWTHIRR